MAVSACKTSASVPTPPSRSERATSNCLQRPPRSPVLPPNWHPLLRTVVALHHQPHGLLRDAAHRSRGGIEQRMRTFDASRACPKSSSVQRQIHTGISAVLRARSVAPGDVNMFAEFSRYRSGRGYRRHHALRPYRAPRLVGALPPRRLGSADYGTAQGSPPKETKAFLRVWRNHDPADRYSLPHLY